MKTMLLWLFTQKTKGSRAVYQRFWMNGSLALNVKRYILQI